MKKILSTLLTLALLLGMGSVGASALSLPKPKFEFPSASDVLNLPKPKIELPAPFAAGESAFTLPRPKLEAPASFSAVFPTGDFSRALSKEEQDELYWQLNDLLWEAYMAVEIQLMLLDYSAPALMLLVMRDPELYLKDGVSNDDVQQALAEALEEIEDFLSHTTSFYYLLDDVLMDFFGIDGSMPDWSDEELEAFMEALKAALDDGSLKAALDEAANAYIADWQAAYACLNDALAALIKPEAMAFAEALCELAALYNEFDFYLMMLNPNGLTKAEIAALEAIYYAIENIIYDTLYGTLYALAEEGKWAEAAALVIPAIAGVEALVTIAMSDSPTSIYTLTYNLRGGWGGPINLKVAVPKNATATLSTAEPIREGYIFCGWAATSGGTTAITSIAMNGNKTVYAIWAPVGVYYTLTYNANGGTGGPAAQAGIVPGTTVTLATTGLPTREGYAFGGWSATSGGKTAITSIAMNGNKTVYAIWTRTYTLTYNANGGTGGPAAQAGIETGATVTLAATGLPTREGYVFGGWSATSGGKTAITSIVMNGNKTVYAIWTAVVVPPVTYTLTYDANGGTGGPAPKTGIVPGTTVTLATTGLPTRAGHTFKGWAPAWYDGGAPLITKVTVNANTTVIAVWEKNPDPPKPHFWDNWPPFLQWILQYILFGWLWMNWF